MSICHPSTNNDHIPSSPRQKRGSTQYGAVAHLSNHAAAIVIEVDDDDVDNESNFDERQPLFVSAGPTPQTSTVDSHNELDGSFGNGPLHLHLLSKTDKELLKNESYHMIKLAIPVIMTCLLGMIPGIVTIILVGRVEGHEDGEVMHLQNGNDDVLAGEEDADENNVASLQKLHMDAAALAIMFMNVVALAPGFGLLSAMDTLCSQAHGANQTAKMGTYALTALFILSIIFLLVSTILWNAHHALLLLGQPPLVCEMAGTFSRYLLPGIPFCYMYEIIRKVSQSRNEAMPMLFSSMVCNLVNGILGYYLVKYTDMGWIGAAVARSVSNVVLVPGVIFGMVGGMGGGKRKKESKAEAGGVGMVDNVIPGDSHRLLYDEIKEDAVLNNASGQAVAGDDEAMIDEDDKEFLHHLWTGFVVSDALSLKAVVEFLELGIPGALQVMFEWWAFEALALLCGILPGNEAIIGIGANAVILNVSSTTYMVYLGMSVAGNVRLGNALGAGDAHRAHVASNLTLILGVITALINIVFLLSTRKTLPWCFTTDIDIAKEAEHLFLIAACYQLPDAINGAVQGIFRGSGRQALAAQWNFVAYYCIGIPLAYIFGIVFGWGVEGLWWGITVGLSVIATGCTGIVLRSDWDAFASEAKARMNGGE